MLVFAAHVPHTPLLLPTVGRDNTEKLKKTTQALKIVAEELYAARPEVIFLISGHGNPTPEIFTVNLNNSYQTNLSEFGDLATKLEYLPELSCVDALQKNSRRAKLPFSVFSEPNLGHATAIPLIMLTEKFKKITVLPFFTAPNLSTKNHFKLGRVLKEVIHLSNKRIAVISAGDLSHALNNQAPAGLRPEGKKFDLAVRGAVKTAVASGLLQLDDELINRAAECALRPIITLFGLLDGVDIRTEELCYEAPFGVGYLTAWFRF
ncbi:MAG: class III extradiol dioxygenase subunit B-like domain-containing protein [Candidatus Uhrbacteria bacterium]